MAFIAPIAAALGPALGSASGLMSLGTTGLSVFSALEAGHYQAAVAKNNAKIAEYNAAAESQAAQQEQIRSDREYAAMVGEELAVQGASGLDVLGRSQTMTRDAQRLVGREQAEDIRARGTGTARRLLQDAANFRAEARQAKFQSYINAAGALMGGASDIAKDAGITSSLATSGRRARKPWDLSPNWYGRG